MTNLLWIAVALAYGLYGYRRGTKVTAETLLGVAKASAEYGAISAKANVADVLEKLASGEDMNLALAALARDADVTIAEAVDVLRIVALILRDEWVVDSVDGLEVVR